MSERKRACALFSLFAKWFSEMWMAIKHLKWCSSYALYIHWIYLYTNSIKTNVIFINSILTLFPRKTQQIYIYKIKKYIWMHIMWCVNKWPNDKHWIVRIAHVPASYTQSTNELFINLHNLQQCFKGIEVKTRKHFNQIGNFKRPGNVVKDQSCKMILFHFPL